MVKRYMCYCSESFNPDNYRGTQLLATDFFEMTGVVWVETDLEDFPSLVEAGKFEGIHSAIEDKAKIKMPLEDAVYIRTQIKRAKEFLGKL